LIFYRQIKEGVEMVRVLHGARDLLAILNSEPGDDIGPDELD
jgi:hypothetical protein